MVRTQGVARVSIALAEHIARSCRARSVRNDTSIPLHWCAVFLDCWRSRRGRGHLAKRVTPKARGTVANAGGPTSSSAPTSRSNAAQPPAGNARTRVPFGAVQAAAEPP